MKTIIFKFLAFLNKIFLPNFTHKRLDLSKANKIQMITRPRPPKESQLIAAHMRTYGHSHTHVSARQPRKGRRPR